MSGFNDKEKVSDMDGNVMVMLGELKGMLQAFTNRFDSSESSRLREVETIHSRIDKHDARISMLESTKNQAQGAVVATKIIVPLVWGMLVAIGGLVLWLLSGSLASVVATIAAAR